MKKKLIKAAVLLLFTVQLNAQTIGKVGINTTTPQAMLHVKDSSVLFSGAATLPATPGNPPASGTGARIMWYPDKAAFRAGLVNDNLWDKDNIGSFSFASGRNSKASGLSTTAMGEFTLASGDLSTAIGNSTTANGNVSTAMGSSTIATGSASTAMGFKTIANGFASTVLGQFNDTVVNVENSITPNTPLLIVGNGTSIFSRSNALVVLKNGNTGINTSAPQHSLHVVNKDFGDGGWTNGIVVENTAPISNPGEAAISFKSAVLAADKFWMVGLNQSSSALGFNYGASFAGGSTRLAIDTAGNIGIGTFTPSSKLQIAGSFASPIQTTGVNIPLWLVYQRPIPVPAGNTL